MTPRRAVIAALWCCALLMQTIGLLHGYVHPHPHAMHGAGQALACESGSSSSLASAGCGDRSSGSVTAHVASKPATTGWLHGLFAGHESGGAGCTLFDQLTHADLLHDWNTLSLAFAQPTPPDAVHAAWHHARQVTGFLARAPPAIG